MGIDGTEIKRKRESSKKEEKNKIPLSGQILMAAVVIILLGCSTYFSFFYQPGEDLQVKKTKQTVTPTIPKTPNREVGKITQDIGKRSVSFGSQKQAQELLTIINDFPGKTEYQISYTTDEDIVLFGCDFSKDVLIRMHDYRNGHGKAETWSGYILYRLEKAETGHSLNDTPNGKIYAHNSSF